MRSTIVDFFPFFEYCVTPNNSEKIIFYSEELITNKNLKRSPGKYDLFLYHLQNPPLLNYDIHDSFILHYYEYPKNHLQKINNDEIRYLIDHELRTGALQLDFLTTRSKTCENVDLNRLVTINNRFLTSVPLISELLSLLCVKKIPISKINLSNILFDIFENMKADIQLNLDNDNLNSSYLSNGNKYWFETFFRRIFQFFIGKIGSVFKVKLLQPTKISIQMNVEFQNPIESSLNFQEYRLISNYMLYFARYFNFQVFLLPQSLQIGFLTT